MPKQRYYWRHEIMFTVAPIEEATCKKKNKADAAGRERDKRAYLYAPCGVWSYERVSSRYECTLSNKDSSLIVRLALPRCGTANLH